MIHNILQIIEPSVAANPRRVALATPETEQLSYRRLLEIVTSYAERASTAGVARHDRVALHAVSMTQYLCMLLALSKLGAVYVRAPDASERGVDADHVLVGRNSGLSGPNVLAIDFSWPAADAPTNHRVGNGFESESDLCLVMGTSGTTGQSKQLGFSLALIAAKVEEKFHAFGALQQRTLLQIPPTTPLGLQLAVLTLRSGGTVVLPRPSAAQTVASMFEGAVDEIFAPPAVYSAWLEQLRNGGRTLSNIKRAVITGSYASPALLHEIQLRICKNLVSNYGSSELGVTAYGQVDTLTAVDGAVGKLVDAIDARIIDESGAELPRGQLGRLQFRSKDPAQRAPYVGASASVATDNEIWFSPGDVGTVTPDGTLCIRGRATELMNVGGNKIAPSAVEAVVSNFLGTAEQVCALGLVGANGFDEVVVVVGADNRRRIGELPGCIERAKLGLGKVHFLAIKTFPLNEFGKVDRIRLRELVATEIARQKKSQLQ